MRRRGLASEQPWGNGGLTFQEVLEILDVVKKSEWGEVEIESGIARLKITRSGSAESDPSASPEAEGGQVSVGAGEVSAASSRMAKDQFEEAETVEAVGDRSSIGIPVKPPMAGIFYSAPSPGAPPFVSLGHEVSKGQQLGIVEVMKLFTPVAAPCTGVLREILVENEAFVQNDQTIMVIEPVEE